VSVEFETFIGVEASPDRNNPFTFASLDGDRAIRAIGSGGIKQAFAFLAGQNSALASINSPATTNKGLIKREEIRKKLSSKSHLGRWANLRLVEFELLQRGINISKTPDSQKRSPKWMRLGFQLFEEIRKLEYEPYPSLIAPKQFFECHGEAVFWNLLGRTPLKENTLEGRLQRQLILTDCGLPVPDAMKFFEEITRHRLLTSNLPVDNIYSQAELNAVAAAYTAWLAANRPERVIKIGHKEEGILFLPDHTIFQESLKNT
jgi:hypothetical protein